MFMSLLRKILIRGLVVLVLLVAAFVLMIGPWPTYGDFDYTQTRYFKQAMEDIALLSQENDLTENPGRLEAGWAVRDITPEVGTPMGGYGGRPDGKRSQGVRDRLYVKALAVSDGEDTAVIVGADMLITPPNLAELVRTEVAKHTSLTANEILFNASHTHCGPGGFGPGIVSRISAGKFDGRLVTFLARQYTEAIIEAYEKRGPARVASGTVDAPQYIRNRARDGIVDPELKYLVIERDSGEKTYVMSYSAHPTIFGSQMMLFSAEYPGELMRFVSANTSAEAIFLGGAVGSMAPRAPEGATADDRVRLMGEALGQLILDDAQDLAFHDSLDVAAIGLSVDMPPLQLRPSSPGWRISPLAAKIATIPTEGWIHAVRLGHLVFVGLPCDFSGEISMDWKNWAGGRGVDLWTLSFCGTYLGYFSPDRYYYEDPLGYEMGAMNWFGPNNEAYFNDLFQRLVYELVPNPL